jgi:hypothetical protein
MKFITYNKFDLPPVIAVVVWKGRVVDVGFS